MRIAAVLLLLAACSSGGPVVDASEGGAPFSWVGGGFTRGEPVFLPETTSREEMTFIFENVSERPQTVEMLLLRQMNEMSAPLRVDSVSRRIDRMIDPGAELEVKVFVSLTPKQRERGAMFGARGVALDITLRHADGTSYRYPIEVPLRTTVPVGP